MLRGSDDTSVSLFPPLVDMVTVQKETFLTSGRIVLAGDMKRENYNNVCLNEQISVSDICFHGDSSRLIIRSRRSDVAHYQRG